MGKVISLDEFREKKQQSTRKLEEFIDWDSEIITVSLFEHLSPKPGEIIFSIQELNIQE